VLAYVIALPTAYGDHEMVSRIRPRDRFTPALGALALACAAFVGPAPILLQMPLAFAVAAAFAPPLLLAAPAFAQRWAGVAFRGRAGLPKPLVQHGAALLPSSALAAEDVGVI
jgi:hypothetical protein